MSTPNLLLLTYLAQVRQLPLKNGNSRLFRAFTMHPFLLIRQSKRRGTSHREIVITGIVPAAAWDGRNKNMGAWLKGVGNWRQNTICTLSQSHAGERK